jgi:uncharacterized cupin superfamily protein
MIRQRDDRSVDLRANREAVLLEIGSRRPEKGTCCYPDNGVIVEPDLKVRP